MQYFNKKKKANRKKFLKGSDPKDYILLYSYPIAMYGNKLDPSETASIVYNNLLRRLQHTHKTSGLTLLQMEHFLKIRIHRGKNLLDELKQDMYKKELIEYDWNGIIASTKALLQLFSVVTSPDECLRVILKLIQDIQKGIENAFQHTKDTGSDELTPTVIYILGCCGELLIKQRALLTIRIIYVLLGPSLKNGIEDFCISVFEGALYKLTGADEK